MLARIAAERFRSSVSVRIACSYCVRVFARASESSDSSSRARSRARGVKSPAEARPTNSFIRRTRPEVDREKSSDAIAPTMRTMAIRGHSLASAVGATKSTASKVARRHNRYTRPNRANRLMRTLASFLVDRLGCGFEQIARASHGFQQGRLVGVDFHLFA